MRHASPRRVAWLGVVLPLLALFACRPADTAGQAEGPRRSDSAETGAKGYGGDDAAIRARADALLAAIRDRQIEAVAEFIHPTQGVRLSPYAFVDVAADRVLGARHFVQAWHDPAPLAWGVEDATGDALRMSCGDYLDRFVYDADFMRAEQVAVDRVIGRGNTINNASDVYPEATIVEYHFPGFEEQYGGLDWRSLRLVFEELEGAWYVVGIIHDEWTS